MNKEDKEKLESALKANIGKSFTFVHDEKYKYHVVVLPENKTYETAILNFYKISGVHVKYVIDGLKGIIY